jgi:hypothetical protein
MFYKKEVQGWRKYITLWEKSHIFKKEHRKSHETIEKLAIEK